MKIALTLICMFSTTNFGLCMQEEEAHTHEAKKRADQVALIDQVKNPAFQKYLLLTESQKARLESLDATINMARFGLGLPNRLLGKTGRELKLNATQKLAIEHFRDEWTLFVAKRLDGIDSAKKADSNTQVSELYKASEEWDSKFLAKFDDILDEEQAAQLSKREMRRKLIMHGISFLDRPKLKEKLNLTREQIRILDQYTGLDAPTFSKQQALVTEFKKSLNEAQLRIWNGIFGKLPED